MVLMVGLEVLVEVMVLDVVLVMAIKIIREVVVIVLVLAAVHYLRVRKRD